MMMSIFSKNEKIKRISNEYSIILLLSLCKYLHTNDLYSKKFSSFDLLFMTSFEKNCFNFLNYFKEIERFSQLFKYIEIFYSLSTRIYAFLHKKKIVPFYSQELFCTFRYAFLFEQIN